jgi:enterochelin esterase family protein
MAFNKQLPMNHNPLFYSAVLLLAVMSGGTLNAQPPAMPPAITSPEVKTDRTVTFRILAPKATDVKLSSSDLPNLNQGAAMKKNDKGIWEVTLGPVDSGAYRYNFNVDGLSVIDPRNPLTSQANENTWSLAYVPGAEFMDTREVPHGAVCQVTYYSSTLKKFRRMHVYLPPGYEAGNDKYPVFYLLHGAFDCDNSWSTVGRAGFILDNLIAANKAKPMIVVMPAGHTGPFNFGAGFGNEFERDFVEDIMPLVEKRYRTLNDRAHRAIAGLSMGGMQTLNISIEHLDQFAYIGVYSSGVFGIAGGFGANQSPTWEEKNKAALDNPDLKKDLKLFWFATGKNDFLLQTSQASVAALKKHGFNVVYKETEGAHTWTNWREYLNEFAPQLFQ